MTSLAEALAGIAGHLRAISTRKLDNEVLFILISEEESPLIFNEFLIGIFTNNYGKDLRNGLRKDKNKVNDLKNETPTMFNDAKRSFNMLEECDKVVLKEVRNIITEAAVKLRLEGKISVGRMAWPREKMLSMIKIHAVVSSGFTLMSHQDSRCCLILKMNSTRTFRHFFRCWQHASI